MTEEKVRLKNFDREYSIYAIPTWLPGVWPLQNESFFSTLRFSFAIVVLVILFFIFDTVC